MPDIIDYYWLCDQADTAEAARAQVVEDMADNLLAECITLEGAERINLEFDLFDGDLLPRLMVEIANWKGTTESSGEQMRKLFNIVAEQLHKIAEGETK
jgi:hypothetical protein